MVKQLIIRGLKRHIPRVIQEYLLVMYFSNTSSKMSIYTGEFFGSIPFYSREICQRETQKLQKIN
jgi:hypothetical protein